MAKRKRNRWEADGPGKRYRPNPDIPWRCLYCKAQLPNDDEGNPVDCPLPRCVEERRAARRRMGLPEGGYWE